MPKPGEVRTFVLRAFTGGMNTIAEDNNLITLDPNASLGAAFIQARTEFRLIENFMPLNRGGQSKTFGYSLFKDTAFNAPITGLYRYIKSDGTSLFIFSQGTGVYKLVSGTITTIGTPVSNNVYPSFETAYDYLIICDGANPPRKWDGTTASNLGGSPPSNAKQARFYQNRLWLFTSGESVVHYSDAANIEAGYASNFVNCDVNDGQKITSLTPFFIPGQLEPVLIVTKNRSIGIITGDGSVGNPYTFQKISLDLGVPGHRQVVQFAQDATLLTPRGVQTYQTAVKNVNIEQSLLTGKVYDQFTSLSPLYIADAHGFFDWKNRRIGYAVATGNSQYPNTIWWYDTEDAAWYKQTGFTCLSALVDTDGTLYTGTSDGKILEHDPTLGAYAGSAINATLSTGFIDFFEPDLYKQIEHCKIRVRGNGTYNLGLSTSLDFGTRTGSSHNIGLTAGAYTWGGGVWTSDSGTYQWGGEPLEPRKFFPRNIFQNIQFNITQSGANQPVDIFELVIRVRYLDLT